MRTLTLTLTMFALFIHGGAALAQQGAKDVTVEAIPIEKVLNANPESDGKAYRIDLLLSEGKKVAYAVPPSEAAKIADGLSKPAIAGGQNRQIATIISGMTIETDSEGKAVILTPRTQSNVMEPLAIPISGAKLLVRALKKKIVQAKRTAARTRNSNEAFSLGREAERQTQAALPFSGPFESLSLSATDLIKVIVMLFKLA